MKANELSCKDLMVGDWVKIKTYGVSDKFERTEAYIYVKVAEIGSGLITVEYNNDIKEPYRICENTEIEPILLTPEILEKNGFVNVENTETSTIIYSFRDSLFRIGVFDFNHIIMDSYYTDSSCDIFISSIHQIQHALRLCGIEKEIIL